MSFDLCKFVDEYHMSKMTERLHRAINTELRRALDYILAPLYDVLLMLPTE